MPEAYAVLVGSGVSRAAGVMTGWEIAVDLARRVAIAEGGSAPADPLAWYAEHHGEDIDYSQLLEHLAPRTGDRQALLNPYFEPTEAEQEQGLKAPTRAHHALAELVAGGYLKIIITTNFDRLIERALQEAGIEPLVIASADDARNAPPLHATRCVVVKLHGDRMSPNLKNTLAELESYEPELEQYLDAILHDYGLIICGWSAEWDTALRNALSSRQSSLFTTFWAHRGEPAAAAQQLIKQRLAVPIAIEDADSFFDAIANKVSAIADLTKASPSGPEVAVAELKRYLPNADHRIRLHDLVMNEIERVITATGSAAMPVKRPIDVRGYMERLHTIEHACETIVALFATLGYHADDKRHDELAVRAMRRLATRSLDYPGANVLLHAQRYPALLSLYALALGALAAKRPRPFARVLAQVEIKDVGEKSAPVGYALAPPHVLTYDWLKSSEEFERRKTPGSDLLHARLRPHLAALVADDELYDGLFDDAEYLLGLAVVDFTDGWGPIGRFGWRRQYPERGARDGIVARHGEDLISAGMFQRSSERLEVVHAAYEEFLNRNAHAFW